MKNRGLFPFWALVSSMFEAALRVFAPAPLLVIRLLP